MLLHQRCPREGHKEAKAKLPVAAAPVRPLGTATCSLEVPAMLKELTRLSANKNRLLLSMYVKCFKRGKHAQVWWLISTFISKSIALILKVQKPFSCIWFITCSDFGAHETLSQSFTASLEFPCCWKAKLACSTCSLTSLKLLTFTLHT